MESLKEPRSVLAILTIAGAFTLAGITMASTGSPDLPDWAVALVSSISTFFFASKGTEKATENHVDMTNRLHTTEQEIETNKAELARMGVLERRHEREAAARRKEKNESTTD